METTLDSRPWLKNYDSDVPANLDYDETPIYELLDRAAQRFPKRPAIIFRNWKISYAQLKKKAEIMAANLQDQGVSPGDRISIMLPNLPQTIISYWAALKAGAVVVMTNPLYMERELVHQIQDSGAEYMIVLDHLWPKVDAVRQRLGVKKFFVTRIPDALAFPLNVLYTFKAKRQGLTTYPSIAGEGVLPWSSLFKGGRRVSGAVAHPKDQLALLQYTGGTTGIAKGVMLTHRNLMVNVQQCLSMLRGITLRKKRETVLGLLPYFHVYGLTVCLNFGTALAATLIPFPRYVPRDVLTAIHKLKPTIFPGAPSVYISLMQQKDIKQYDLTSIDYCVSGSAPMPLEGMRRFKDLTGAEIIEGYGLTEASPVTHLNPLGGKRKNGSIGMPFPDTDCRIVDMDLGTVPLPPGKIGEMIIKGPQVMRGYWNRPDDTASTLRNGWLYTGDIATMDEDGYFTIVDRKKDMIISGGYNVYPREIDEVLLEHPKIQDAVTVGIPHHARGEIIKAYVVVRPGETLEKSDVISHCKAKLANYKIPKQVEFRKDLPKSIVGKVLRRVLKAEEAEKHGGKDKTPSAPTETPPTETPPTKQTS